jgi:hypothetical protein
VIGKRVSIRVSVSIRVRVRFTIINTVSPEYIDLLLLLITDSHKRLGCNGCEELKAHRWFANIDWSNLRSVEARYLPPGSA